MSKSTLKRAGTLSLMLVLGGTIACFSKDPAPPDATVAAEVEARNFVFSPDTVFIEVGETVRWTVTQGQHTVTGDPAQAQAPASVRLPPGAATFDSGFLDEGETFEHTFQVAGVYKYFCIPHELQGMVGWVVVQ